MTWRDEISPVACPIVSIRMMQLRRPTIDNTRFIFNLIESISFAEKRELSTGMLAWFSISSLIESSGRSQETRKKSNIHSPWWWSLSWEHHVLLRDEIGLVDQIWRYRWFKFHHDWVWHQCNFRSSSDVLTRIPTFEGEVAAAPGFSTRSGSALSKFRKRRHGIEVTITPYRVYCT